MGIFGEQHWGISVSACNNSEWLIERHGHCTPREVYATTKETKAA